jgi:hypothetical protein
LSNWEAASPPLRAQTERDKPVIGSSVRHHEPLGARLARRDVCGLDRRALAPHLRCKVISRPPLPAPCLEMLIRHPSVMERDAPTISARKRAGITFLQNAWALWRAGHASDLFAAANFPTNSGASS